jgi:hypothetical protein
LSARHRMCADRMEKKKAEQAKKKADKAKGIEPKKEAKKPAAKASQEERFRRASLVVDVAAMANFQVRPLPLRRT